MAQERFRVVFTGGGSGGHVYPLIAVAEALRKRVLELHAPTEFIYMGPKDPFSILLEKRGVTFIRTPSAKMRRYFSFENIFDIPKFLIALVQALFELYFIMPDVIFSKGGTGALPVVIAGWFYRIPVIIHESDAQPGLTNLASGRFASKVFVSFMRAAQFFNKNKVEISGPPVREELLDARPAKEVAKETLGFDPKQPLILVIGGSQGSVRINEFILENLEPIIKDTQVLHQTGVANFLEAQKLSRAVLIDQSTSSRYHPVNYFDDNIATALAASDIAVARAGSGTIFELAAFGVPAILIPMDEGSNGHQRINAYEFAEKGGGVVIEESNLLPGIFLTQLKAILGDENRRAQMAAASAQFFTPGGAEKIAEAILKAGA